MLAAGLRPNPLRELKRSPDFIFRSQLHQNRLAAGLRQDPLGELKRSPIHPTRSGCHGREHSLMQLGVLCCEEEGGVEVSGRAEIYESDYF